MSIAQALGASANEYALILERDEARAELARAEVGVTVCVPCFEQSEFLAECLDSIYAQTVPAYETIVVDDGSDPGEGELIAAICSNYPDTSYVRVTNRRLPGARNTGLMLTKTVGFLPLDADDWVEPAYIEQTLPLLLAGADVVVPGLQEHGPTRNGTYMPGFDRPLDQVDLDLMWNGFNRTFYASLFRTRVVREAGGYNGLMTLGFEDYDLAIDLMTRGANYVACDQILFNYRTRPESMLTSAMRRKDEIMAEMRRHHRC